MKNTAQTLMQAWSIAQFKNFAYKCETLRLHALAARVFRQLMILDPDNRNPYFAHVLYNRREAECRGLALLLSKTEN